MSRLKIIFMNVFLILAAFTSINVRAQTTVTDVPVTTITTTAPSATTVEGSGQPMIVTPVPSAKEIIATPEGYINCFTVEASWNKNAWVPEHRICQYQSSPNQTMTYEGVAWIDSYWACTEYTASTCTKWEWKPGHWVKTLEVY